MAEFFGPLVTFSEEPAQFAGRGGRDGARYQSTTLAHAEAARQQWQRRQAAQQQKGHHTMKMPPIPIPAPSYVTNPRPAGLDPTERRRLLQVTAYGRAVLKDEDAAQPAQFAAQPLSAEVRAMLSTTFLGRSILAQRGLEPTPAGVQAQFAHGAMDDGVRRLLSATALGRAVLQERGIAPLTAGSQARFAEDGSAHDAARIDYLVGLAR